MWKTIAVIAIVLLYVLMAMVTCFKFKKLKKCTTVILLYIAEHVMLILILLGALLFLSTLKIIML